MASSPFIEQNELVSLSILVDGSEIDDSISVIRLETYSQLGRISSAELAIDDGDPAQQEFKVSSSATFVPGNEIEIKAGYMGKNDTIFKGVIVSQSIEIDGLSHAVLEVFCRDKSLALTLSRQNKVYSQIKDSDLISKLCSDYSVTSEVDATTIEHKELVQFDASDWDFLLARAQLNGLVVYTQENKIIAQEPNVSDSPSIVVTYGYDLLEFNGKLDASEQNLKAQVTTWDYSGQSTLTATSNSPNENEQGNISGETLANVLNSTANISVSQPSSQDEIQVLADSIILRERLSRITGNVLFQGNASPTPNATIELAGLGDRFNGNAYISSVKHSIEGGNWNTEVGLGLDPQLFLDTGIPSSPKAANMIPGLEGLQSGVVKQTYEDPDNGFRVQVTLPMIYGDEKELWARLSSFYAGTNYGNFFIPEVGDEVVVGFFNNDPRYPVILGSLYSSGRAPKDQPEENNYIKSLTTKGELNLTFDDENKVITIQTPEGNVITMNDTDKKISIVDMNENKIIMDDSGVTINSPSDITIKADGDLNMEGTNVSIKASADLKGQGADVSINGDMSVKMSGSASLEASSDGQTTVKGSMVSIN